MVECYLVERTNKQKRWLRRYAHLTEGVCPASQYNHNAETFLDYAERIGFYDQLNLEWDHSDNRWPTQCKCGYVFKPDDQWQLFVDSLYRNVETGEERRILMGIEDEDICWEAGAIYRAEWYEPNFVGEDNRSYCVILPSNEMWSIDSPATGGGRWTRSGVPPKFTVRPSILTPKYHGFLTDGRLESV